MNAVCTFCWDLLFYGKEIRVTGCGHCFHVECMASIIERNEGCPVCQSAIIARNVNQLFPLYLNADVQQPLYNRVYRELVLNLNELQTVQTLNIRFGRVMISKHEMNSTINCTVCLECLWDPDEDMEGTKVTACGHPFHTACINRCIKEGLRCPHCRKIVHSHELNVLHFPTQKPLFERVYPDSTRLRFNRNDSSEFEFMGARVAIYGNRIPPNTPRKFDYNKITINF